VPTRVPPHEPLYQFHVAPVPNDPPLTESVTDEPTQIDVALAFIELAATDATAV
jgi:hypothetical protein